MKALQDALGEVRDCQVQRRWFARRAGRGGARTACSSSGPARACRRRASSCGALLAWRGAVAPSVAQAATDAAGKGTLQGKRLAKELRVRLRVLRRRPAAARDDPTARAAHRLRHRGEEAPVHGRARAPRLSSGGGSDARGARAAPDRLGDLHDTDVRLERLERPRPEGHAPRAAPRARDARRAREERARGGAGAAPRAARWRDERIVRALRRGLTRPESAGALAAGTSASSRHPARSCRGRASRPERRGRLGVEGRGDSGGANPELALRPLDLDPRAEDRAEERRLAGDVPQLQIDRPPRFARTLTTPFLRAVRTERTGW